ncbi:MAG TPA: hypothetical protein VIM73_12840 [Polyangiaceae bacterium]
MHSSRSAVFVLLGTLIACSGEDKNGPFEEGDGGTAGSAGSGTASGGRSGSSGTPAGGGKSDTAGASGTLGSSGSAGRMGRGGAGGSGGSKSTGGSGGKGSAGTAGAGPQLPTDPSGFTELTKSSDTVTIYVSSSTGNDSNNGKSEQTAVRSVAKGVSLLREGSADWLLFKRGDSWTTAFGGWTLSGRSPSERIVVGAYGTGARPRFDVDDEGGIRTDGGASEKEYLDNLVFTSLHFVGVEHDPSRGEPTGPTPMCVSWLRGGNDVLFEDNLFEYCMVHVDHFDGFPARRFKFHRNLFLDSYSMDDSHAQAILLHGVQAMVLSENVFDRCGWHPDFEAADPTVFNHCIYWQTDSAGDGIVRGNIIMRAASHGAQMRSSGRVENNVFIGVPIGGFVAGQFSTPPPTDVEGTVIGNLFTEPQDTTPREGHPGDNHRGWGWDFSPDGRQIQNAVVRENIFTHCSARDCKSVVRSQPDTTIEDNIVWDWESPADYQPESAGPFADPDRSIASYNESLGGEESFEAFAAQVRAQSKTNWRPAYTAEAILEYFREGFEAP